MASARAFLGPHTWAQAPAGGQIVAVGTNVVMTSNDGLNWNFITPPTDRWVDVCYAASLGMFLAVSSTSSSSSVMYSTDNGATWTVVTGTPTPGGSGWSAVTWSAALGLFCAVSQTGDVMTSGNGTSWTSRTGVASGAWHGITWSPDVVIGGTTGAFCAAGPASDYLMTSPDGITWTARTPSTVGAWGPVAWSHDLGIFAVLPDTGGGGASGNSMWSTDGVTWNTGSTAQIADPWLRIAWGKPSGGAGRFVAVSEFANYLQYSTDGKTWSQAGISYAAAAGLASVCWSDSLQLFIAVMATSGTHRAQVSADGLTWTDCTSTTPTQHAWVAIACSG